MKLFDDLTTAGPSDVSHLGETAAELFELAPPTLTPRSDLHAVSLPQRKRSGGGGERGYLCRVNIHRLTDTPVARSTDDG